MILTQKNRNAHSKKFAQGPGGRHCPCCDTRNNRAMRRTMRRIEKQKWIKEL